MFTRNCNKTSCRLPGTHVHFRPEIEFGVGVTRTELWRASLRAATAQNTAKRRVRYHGHKK